jgi:hypothetical protein
MAANLKVELFGHFNGNEKNLKQKLKCSVLCPLLKHFKNKLWHYGIMA